MIGNIKYFLRIIDKFKFASIILLLLILLGAIIETLSFGMVTPLMELISEPSSANLQWVNYLSPILSHFPAKYNVLIVGGLFVALMLIKNALLIGNAAYSSYYVYRFRKYWQCKIMRMYMYAEYPYFLSKKQGVLLNNLLIEPPRGAKSVQLIIDFISKVILGIFLYALLLFAHWQITIVMTMVGFSLFLLFRKAIQRYSFEVGKKKIELSQKIASICAENVSAIRQVKTFSIESKIVESFEMLLSQFIRIMIKFTVIKRMPKPVIESIVIIGIVGFMLYVNFYYSVNINQILPILVLFVIVCQRFIPVIAALVSEGMSIMTFLPSLDLVYRLGETEIEKENLESGRKIEELPGDIVFKDVTFSYKNNKTIFDQFNFIIPKGEIVAFVGESGSGKTTIVDILFGLQKIQGGNIRIGGIDFSEIELNSWRNLIGYVSQDTFLFNATIKENILVGNPSASKKEIRQAIDDANASLFINDFENGYDTVVGDRGSRLSGGQRQRIAIARAIIRNPEVYIFDEATSSLDTLSEKNIQNAIDKLTSTRKKTVILISHRIATVKNADIIYVIDKGKIVESGSYDELKNYRGAFYKMNNM